MKNEKVMRGIKAVEIKKMGEVSGKEEVGWSEVANVEWWTERKKGRETERLR